MVRRNLLKTHTLFSSPPLPPLNFNNNKESGIYKREKEEKKED